MSLSPGARSAAAIAAATAMNLPFGTIYAFSVFLKPMESALGVSRAEMSFVFGLAACSLTLWMNLTPWLYRRFSPVLIAALGGVGSAAGLVITAFASGFLELVIGYGLLFGIGGGMVKVRTEETTRSQRFKHPSSLYSFIRLVTVRFYSSCKCKIFILVDNSFFGEGTSDHCVRPLLGHSRQRIHPYP